MLTNREIFNHIAPSWYAFHHHTRFKTELESLAQRWRRGKLLNLGCGHGPDFLPFKDKFDLYGIDFSVGMIEQAEKYAQKYNISANLLVADLGALPFGDETFNYAIAIASYHHLRGGTTVLNAFRELHRVLKNDAEVFITLWNKRQPRFWFSRKEVFVPWHTKSCIYQRYYYLYTEREIVNILNRAGFIVVKSVVGHPDKLPLKLFPRNICLLVKAG